MKALASVSLGRMPIVMCLVTVLLAGCASTGEVDDGKELSMAECPQDLKLHCFKRTARRQECFCVDPGELENLLDQIGPKGRLERERDRWD